MVGIKSEIIRLLLWDERQNIMNYRIVLIKLLIVAILEIMFHLFKLTAI